MLEVKSSSSNSSPSSLLLSVSCFISNLALGLVRLAFFLCFLFFFEHELDDSVESELEPDEIELDERENEGERDSTRESESSREESGLDAELADESDDGDELDELVFFLEGLINYMKIITSFTVIAIVSIWTIAIIPHTEVSAISFILTWIT